jgi:hypothetical protein
MAERNVHLRANPSTLIAKKAVDKMEAHRKTFWTECFDWNLFSARIETVRKRTVHNQATGDDFAPKASKNIVVEAARTNG